MAADQEIHVDGQLSEAERKRLSLLDCTARQFVRLVLDLPDSWKFEKALGPKGAAAFRAMAEHAIDRRFRRVGSLESLLNELFGAATPQKPIEAP
jgi:hypothetical protein